LSVREQPNDDLMPVLVADLADEDSRVLLEAVAAAGGEAYVPLVIAPMDASAHVLEVYSPGSSTPLLLTAVPLGPPSPEGFLLRLSPLDSASGTYTARKTYESAPAVLKPRKETSHRISARHAASLGSVPPPQMEAALVGRTVGGKFVIERLIGTGGLGAVYRAVHQGLQMPVAVKVLHERFQSDLEFCKSFHAEALAASRLDHPHLVRVVDFGQEPDGLLYFTMELLDGTTLRDVIQGGGKQPLERIVELMSQVCSGLAHAHARNIVHRDLKPENVVLVASPDDEEGTERRHVKICDFGLAVAGRSEARSVSGTPEYMSPEQCAGEVVDARSDVYACGVMLYELATGQLPFDGPNPMAILNRHMCVEPTPPSQLAEVDPRLERIILRALRKDPAERQQSARELRRELDALLAADAEPSSQREPAGAQRTTSGATRAEWLDDNAMSGSFVSPLALPKNEALEELIADPARWLKQLADARDPRAFTALCGSIERGVSHIAERGHFAVLWRLASTVSVIADEGPRTAGSRALNAHRLHAAVLDPDVLALVAHGLLRGEGEEKEALRLLQDAKVAGAYALYGVRARATWDDAARARFSSAMRSFGENAWPALRAALEKLEPQVARAPELVWDLFAAAPDVPDDAAGQVIARYLASASPVLRAVATTALARAWGRRARAMLLALLQDPDDGVRVAAIAALEAQQDIDEHVVRKLAAILQPQSPAGGELRARVIGALSRVGVSGGLEAANALTKVVNSSPGQGTSEQLILLAARALLRIPGNQAAPVLQARAAHAQEPLRSKLLELIAGKK
jgi:serine/threonine-protein kinase